MAWIREHLWWFETFLTNTLRKCFLKSLLNTNMDLELLTFFTFPSTSRIDATAATPLLILWTTMISWSFTANTLDNIGEHSTAIKSATLRTLEFKERRQCWSVLKTPPWWRRMKSTNLWCLSAVVQREERDSHFPILHVGRDKFCGEHESDLFLLLGFYKTRF